MAGITFLDEPRKPSGITYLDDKPQSRITYFEPPQMTPLPSEQFDPEGAGYDYQSAIKTGDKPGPDGHWSSIAPLSEKEALAIGLPSGSGLIVKGTGHESFQKTLDAEAALGNKVVKGDNGRYYSVPNINRQEYSGALDWQAQQKSEFEQFMQNQQDGVNTAAVPVSATSPELYNIPADYQKPGAIESGIVGAAEGTLGVGQAGGAATEMLGDYFDQVRSNIIGATSGFVEKIAPKYIERKRQEKPATITEKRKNLLQSVGETAYDTYKGQLDDIQQTYPSGDITRDPALLLDPAWWSRGMAQAGVSMSTGILLGGGTGAGTAIAGGAIEALPNYIELIDEGMAGKEAAARTLAFATFVAAGEKLSLDKLFRGKSKSAIRKILAGMLSEGLQEASEEPADAIIKNLAREGVTPTELGEKVLESFRSGANVFFTSALSGGGMSLANQVAQQTQQEAVIPDTIQPEAQTQDMALEAPAPGSAEAPFDADTPIQVNPDGTITVLQEVPDFMAGDEVISEVLDAPNGNAIIQGKQGVQDDRGRKAIQSDIAQEGQSVREVERLRDEARTVDKVEQDGVSEKLSASQSETVTLYPKESASSERWFHGSHDNVKELGNRAVESVDSIGSWVTADQKKASDYGPNVVEAKATPKNLLEAHTENFDDFFYSNKNLFKELFPDEPVSTLEKFKEGGLRKKDPGAWEMRKAYLSAFRRMLTNAGHDGIIWKDSNIDGRPGDKPHDVAVFFNEQPISTQTPAPEAKTATVDSEQGKPAKTAKQEVVAPVENKQAAGEKVAEAEKLVGQEIGSVDEEGTLTGNKYKIKSYVPETQEYEAVDNSGRYHQIPAAAVQEWAKATPTPEPPPAKKKGLKEKEAKVEGKLVGKTFTMRNEAKDEDVQATILRDDPEENSLLIKTSIESEPRSFNRRGIIEAYAELAQASPAPKKVGRKGVKKKVEVVEALPERTADTMSEAISMSSPEGKVSKRARAKAEKDLSKKLFGEKGLQVPAPKQPTDAERAEQLRDMAKIAPPAQAKKLTAEADALAPAPEKSKGEKKPSFLDTLEAEIDAEIKTLKNQGTVGLNKPLGLATNYVMKGAIKIARGTTDFAKWSAEMVSEFGEAIKPHLQKIFDAAKELSNRAITDVNIYRTEARQLSKDIGVTVKDLPKKVKKGKHKFAVRLLSDESKIDDAIKAGLQPEYEVLTNEESASVAIDLIDSFDTLDDAIDAVKTGTGMEPAVRSMAAQIVAQRLDLEQALLRSQGATHAANAALTKASEFFQFVMEDLQKKAGQGIQAFAAWDRMSPEGMVMAAQKAIMNEQEKKGNPGKADIKKMTEDIRKGMDEDQKELQPEIVLPAIQDRLKPETRAELAQKADEISEEQTAARDADIQAFSKIVDQIMAEPEKQKRFRDKMRSSGERHVLAGKAKLEAMKGRMLIGPDVERVAALVEVGYGILMIKGADFAEFVSRMKAELSGIDLKDVNWRDIYNKASNQFVSEAIDTGSEIAKEPIAKKIKKAKKEKAEPTEADYVERAAKRLLSKEKVDKMDDPMKQLFNRIVNQLKAKMPNDLPAKKKSDPFGILEEALANKEKYSAVVEAWYDLAIEQAAEDGEIIQQIEDIHDALSADPIPSSEKNLSRAVGAVLRAFEANLGEIIKTPARNQAEFIKNLTENMQLALGLSPDASTDVANAIAEEVSDRLAAKVQQRKDRILGNIENKAVRKAALSDFDKLAELVNMGLFTDEQVYNALAAKMGLPAFTNELAQEIARIAREAQNAPEGIPKKRKMDEAEKLMRRAIGVKLSDLMFGIFYARMLSGFSTHQVNVINNSLTRHFMQAVMVVSRPSRIPQTVRDIAAGYKTGFWKGFIDASIGVRTGFWRGRWTDGNKWNIRGGLDDVTFGEVGGVPLQGGKTARVAEKILEFDPTLGLSNRAQAKLRNGGAVSQALAETLNKAGVHPANLYKYSFRTLQAEDAVAYNKALEARVRVLARDKAGNDEAEFERLIAGGSVMKEQADKQAEAEGFTGQEAQQRSNEIIEQNRNLKDVQEPAARFATFFTFNSPLRSTVMGWLAKGINKIAARGNVPIKLQKKIPFTDKIIGSGRIIEIPVGAILKAHRVPFTNIVANVADWVIDLSPVGALRALYDENQGRTEVPLLMRERLVISAFGTLLMSGIAAMMFGDDDDDDDKWEIIGAGPQYNKRGMDAWSKSGRKPWSVYKKGVGSFPFKETPLAIPLAFAGGFSDAVRYGNIDNDELMQRTALAGFNMWKMFYSMAFLEGLSDAVQIVEPISGPATWRAIKKDATRTASSIINNRIFTQIGKVFDPTVYDNQTIKQMMLKDIPVLNATLSQPAVGYDGKPRRYNGDDPLSRIFYRFFTPAVNTPDLEYMGKHNDWTFYNPAEKQDWMDNEIYREYEIAWRKRLNARMIERVKGNINKNIDDELNDWKNLYRKQERTALKQDWSKEAMDKSEVSALLYAYQSATPSDRKKVYYRLFGRNQKWDNAQSAYYGKKDKQEFDKLKFHETRTLANEAKKLPRK